MPCASGIHWSKYVRFISWEIRQYFRVQFNARQSSAPKLQLLTVTCILHPLSIGEKYIFLYSFNKQ